MNTKKHFMVPIFIVLLLQFAACGNENMPPETTESLADTTIRRASLLEKMHYFLPEDLIPGEFDIFLGGGGGIPLLKTDNQNDTTRYGGTELWLMIDGIFEDGELIGVEYFSNHSYFSEFTPCESGAPCVTVLFSRDVFDENINKYVGEERFWYAFWAVEGFNPVYALYLNADYYDSTDLIAIAETVTFSEGAFDIVEID